MRVTYLVLLAYGVSMIGLGYGIDWLFWVGVLATLSLITCS